MHPTEALGRATEEFRRRAAKERGRGGTARVGNARGDLIHAAHLAATAGQSLDLLLEAFEHTLLAEAKAEEGVLGHAYELLLQARREVRALHLALQAAEEGHDPPTEEEMGDLR